MMMMTTMMKNPVVVVTCILLLSPLGALASLRRFAPDKCCFNFYPHRPRTVVEITYTHKNCPHAGVLFRVKNGAKFCVDPTVTWVKEIIEAKTAERPGRAPRDPRESDGSSAD